MTLPEIKNNRYIQYDDNTVIGYDFPNQKFYVINKDTKTTRNTAEQIVNVLHALRITDYTATQLEELIKNNIEVLGTIEGTLTDDGSYIRALQFNEWVDYPLAVDCEKKNLYIKNTNVSFSLEIDDSDSKRAEEFCSYYELKLGFKIDEDVMRAACNLLANQYEVPSFYNVLSKNAETNVLKYTNLFNMNNFSAESSVTCNGIRNPNNTFESSRLGQIQSIDNENDLITLKTPIDSSSKFLTRGFQVSISGASYEEDGTTYTADGTYTINQVFMDTTETDKIKSIQVDEPITASYEYPYPTCYIKSGTHNIYSMQRENNVIKVEAKDFPNSLITGNKVHVENAIAGNGYGTVDLSGIYTVQNVSTQIKQISDTVLEMGTKNDKNAIVISTPITDLKVGDVLQVSGTNTTDDNMSYTISEDPIESSSNTTLYVEEAIPYSYGQTTSETMNLTFEHNDATGDNLIVLPEGSMLVTNPQDLINISNASPNNGQYTILQVIVGANNKITLKVGETVTTTENPVSASVTIISMNPVSLTSQTIMYYNLYVEEEILTDFISTSSQQAIFFKEDFVSNIVNINNTSRQITLEDSGSTSLEGETLYIYTNANRYERIVEAVNNSDNNLLTLNEAVGEGMPDPALSSEIPSPEVTLEITDVQGELSNAVPIGNFTLDNFNQCQSYVESLRNLDEEITSEESKVPSLLSVIDNKMYTELKENSELAQIGTFSVTFKGLYSEIYPS